MSMFGNLLSWADGKMAQLGYIKANDLPKMTHMLFSGEGLQYQQDFMAQTESEMQKLAINNPWVYSNIDLISGRIAMARLMVEAQDSEGLWVEDPKHAFTHIMETRPNPYMGQVFIWKYQAFWLLLQGECYWMQVPDKAGVLREVYPLPANRMMPLSSDTELFRGFQYLPTRTGSPQILEPEHVLFNRLPNPFNYNRGLSPLTAYQMGLQVDFEAAKFDLQDFQSGLTLAHIISLRPEISDPDAFRYQKEIDSAVAEGKRFMVTRGGDIKVAPIASRRGGTSATDNVRALTKMEADLIYGVPEGLRTSNATQANATVAERIFASDTIWPLLTLLAEDITVQSVLRYYAENERAVFEDIRIPNKEEDRAADTHSWEYMTYDEVREQQGLDPYHDERIGVHKFTVVDDLIKKVFEAELATEQAEADEAAMAERDLQVRAEMAPEPELEEDEVPAVDEGVVEDEEDDFKSEAMYWLQHGWLPQLERNGHTTFMGKTLDLLTKGEERKLKQLVNGTSRVREILGDD